MRGRRTLADFVNGPSVAAPGEPHRLAVGDLGPEPAAKEVGRYIVALQALEPLPRADERAPDFYTATLVVQARGEH